MRVGKVVVVAGTIEIGRHGGEIAGSVLAVVAPAHLDARDLGERVGAVGRFKRPGEKRGFGHGLRGELGIDAGGAEEEQTLDAVPVAGVDDVGLQNEVVADEVGGVGVVGENAADLRGREEDVLRLFGREELVDCLGVEQVELGTGAGEDVGVAEARQLAVDGRADEAPMTGDEDTRVFVHGKAHLFVG